MFVTICLNMETVNSPPPQGHYCSYECHLTGLNLRLSCNVARRAGVCFSDTCAMLLLDINNVYAVLYRPPVLLSFNLSNIRWVSGTHISWSSQTSTGMKCETGWHTAEMESVWSMYAHQVSGSFCWCLAFLQQFSSIQFMFIGPNDKFPQDALYSQAKTPN